MKIGILTQPLINNYGGILQAYALSSTLLNMGYDVEIIDRKFEYQKYNPFMNTLKFFIKKFILRRRNPDYHKDQQRRLKDIQNFIKQNISLSSTTFYQKNINDINKQQYDAIIVGSDQVWRPAYSPCIYNYFLDFCKNNSSIRKIAYSASFGVDNWEYNAIDTEICSRLVKKFHHISVRENSAINLCKKYFDIDVKHTLDPTLLLEKEDYINLINAYSESPNEGSLFCYVLDERDEKSKIINQVAKYLNLIPFNISLEKSNSNEFSENELLPSPSITKWLSGFRDAKYIITDSFHGCVFSIIFNKPFIVIGNQGRGLARFESLLSLFNLKKQLIFDAKNLDIESLTSPFDWDKINEKRKNSKLESLSFLKNALGDL